MSKLLIAYFSRPGNNYVDGNIVNLAIGNTELIANEIHKQTNGTLFRIDPVRKYSEDYYQCTAEAQQDKQEQARPKLTNYLDSIDEYDTIVLCYPNYWGTMPMPVWTFLEHCDTTGKTILPLCTHEGSGMGSSELDLAKLCPSSTIKRGLPITGRSVKHAEQNIADWLKSSL